MPKTLEVGMTDSTAARFARVVPLAFMTYSLAFLDRTNFGYAANGMTHTLHLTANQAALFPSLFFPGYCLFQIPAANYASRHSVRWLVFWSLILWGVLSALPGVITNVPLLPGVISNVHLLMISRFMLGAVEGVVLPCMLVFLTRWFTRGERSRANALLMVGNPITLTYASAMSGYLIDYFNNPLHHHLNREGWQMMFILEGLPSILWAFIWLIFAKDHPSDVKWLGPAATEHLQRRLDAEQSEISPIRHYWAAFADSRVIRLSLMFVCFSAAGYAFMFWMPEIVQSASGRGIGYTGLLISGIYLVACFSVVIVSWFSDRTMQRKKFVWGSHIVGAIGYLLAALAGQQHLGLAFLALVVVGSCTYTPTSPQWAWMAEMLPRNVIGESMALVNSFGAIGGFIGAYFGGLLNGHYKGPGHTFVFCACCLICAGALGLSVQERRKSEDRGFPVIANAGETTQAA